MKKLKKVWQENRVILVLGIVIILCLCAISVVVVRYFIGTGKSVYGDRLNGIENVSLDSGFLEEVKTKVLEDTAILSMDFAIKGKIVYVTMHMDSSVNVVVAETKAFGVLEKFEERHLNFYDFQFTLIQDASDISEGYVIMGARNANGNGVIWNNNTPISNESTTGEE